MQHYHGRLSLAEIAHHRNGIGGAPFYVVRFFEQDNAKPAFNEMLATVFEEPGHVAVLRIDKLPAIAFGENSYRGDVFEPTLRNWIARWEGAQRATTIDEPWDGPENNPLAGTRR